MNLTEIIQSKNDGKTLSKIDEMRYNFITQRLDEEVYKGYIIAYHRTRDAEKFMDISNKKGFTTMGKGKGAMYGVGLYGNYTWDGVNTYFSKREYGDYIIKYIVKPNNIIFFDDYTQLKVYGKRMSIIEQCQYWGISLNSEIRSHIVKIDEKMKKNNVEYTSEYALQFYKKVILQTNNINNTASQFYGISYNGNNDQDTILMYDFRNLTVLGFYDQTNTFHKHESHNFYNIKSVSKNTINNTNVNNLITLKDDHDPDYVYDKKQNKIIDKNKITNSNGDYVSFSDLTLDEKFSLFNMYYQKSKDKTKYIKIFINLFFNHPESYEIKSNGVNFLSRQNTPIISNIKLDFLPFKLLDSNQPVLIDNCDFTDLTFMFNSIDTALHISNCESLKTLYGIEKMDFGLLADNLISRSVKMENLPKLQSLQFLPKETSSLTLKNIPLIDLKSILQYRNIGEIDINNCVNIKLNDGLPKNIQFLNYNNKSDKEIDLSLLSKYKQLSYVKINGKILNKILNNWKY